MRLRERIAKLPARTLASALRCPYDWVPEYRGLTPQCKRGENCDECIARLLDEPMEVTGVRRTVELLPQDVRARVEEVLKRGE